MRMFNKRITCRLLACLLFFNCLPALLFAQGTQAIITGTVVDNKGESVIGATIQVKNESTGFFTGSITNDKGEYTIKQLPLGSPYTVTASYIGYGEQKKTGYALNQGDMLRVDFKLAEESVEIQAVEVVANSLKNMVPKIGAATSISAQNITKLPVNGRNFTSLMDLSPLSSGGNIAGQLSSSTNYTIDGMTAKGTVASGTTSGAYTISMEAVREFEVVTNQYDVTNGRSGGGTVSAVTKSGTNTFTGSVFGFGRADWLSSSYDIRGNKSTSDFSTYQYGFSLGGPIVKDRAHFYVVWDHQQDSRPIYIADIKTAVDEMLWIWQRKSNNIKDLKGHIWDEWADEDGSIGKAYGYQLGKKHKYKEGEMDQVDRVLFDLKENPFSRRIMTNIYVHEDLHEMNLYPCAYSMTFNVTGNRLNAILNQRSQDILAANNWNVVQYAALLMMFAQVSGFEPGELVHVIADAHIYDRHIPIVKELIQRPVYPAPKVTLNPEVKDFYKFTVDDFTIEDYEAGPQIKNIPIAI